MKVVVDGAAGTVTAEDVENLRELSVALRSADAELAGQVLGQRGRVDGTHVWLDIEVLKAFGPVPRNESWTERFAAAMAYAAGKGWTDETGRLVRAHVEESSS
ncbi:hypothetical protein [Amycolatopsis sp. FDAARGOS 1241]|uniref:hypothetical protein n=1 Tax=Amycolatopsis sp. FDAARGOS 1241 TaxID=2778070 RepID=UPI00194F6F56|nr:hypothetical protein [Amycolatopsis sp. FDAARGOS 1241]QRP42836.1 hypothetical protein I6J71_25570 [Amycolatopsis sp. FDAARGOS 1241]